MKSTTQLIQLTVRGKSRLWLTACLASIYARLNLSGQVRTRSGLRDGRSKKNANDGHFSQWAYLMISIKPEFHIESKGK